MWIIKLWTAITENIILIGWEMDYLMMFFNCTKSKHSNLMALASYKNLIVNYVTIVTN